jgi:hypothetical protein
VIVAFLGPSLPASEARGVTVLPPASQGDVWRALRRRPTAIALIDGVFESRPSVWHHEILDALDAGVLVFGGASMGALRAAELHTRGMIGVGRIFRWYRDAEVIDDSEVALLHGDAEHGFVPLTVPLVNVRWAAQEAVRARVLRARDARALVEHSAGIFYQERTWPAVLSVLPAAAREKWGRWKAPDLKADDAREVLRAVTASDQPPSTPRMLVGARRPAPSSFVRRRRVFLDSVVERLRRRADARQLADAGLRRALLAGWARESGLRPSPAEVRDAEETWRRLLRTRDLGMATGLDADQVLRVCEELALERVVLDHAERFINDGPSADEALLAEARLRGLAPAKPRR